MDVNTYNKLVKVDVLTSKDLDSYKSGIFDAVVHGNKDDDKRCHHYKQGYDYQNSLHTPRISISKKNTKTTFLYYCA